MENLIFQMNGTAFDDGYRLDKMVSGLHGTPLCQPSCPVGIHVSLNASDSHIQGSNNLVSEMR